MINNPIPPPLSTMAVASNAKIPFRTTYYYVDIDDSNFKYGQSPKDKIRTEMYHAEDNIVMCFTYYEGAEGVRKGDVMKFESFYVNPDGTHIRHGPCILFYEDGSLWSESNFLFGKLHGEQSGYDREGNVVFRVNH